MATKKLLEETGMKKIMVGILTSALIFAISASSAFAAAPEKRDNFADANEDGICDNYNGIGGNGTGVVDQDNDGVCDNRGNGGRGQENHRNFADADGDGICDNYNGTGGNGTGVVDEDNDGVCDNRGNGGRGQGNHRNFSDANGDGICDNYSEKASSPQNMERGAGSRGRCGK